MTRFSLFPPASVGVPDEVVAGWGGAGVASLLSGRFRVEGGLGIDAGLHSFDVKMA